MQWGNKRGKVAGTTIESDAYDKANALVSDIVLNYKTVFAFGEKNVSAIFEKFHDLMLLPLNNKIKNAHLAGFFFGYAQASRMIFLGLIFWLGSVVIKQFNYDPQSVYLCINVLISASMGAGMSISNLPSIQRAKSSARKIFKVIDEKSELDVREGKKS